MGFKKILEPGKIGRMEIRNRIVYPAVVTNYAGLFGEVTNAHIEYYSRIARGGVGLVTVEAGYVMPDYCDRDYNARATSNQLGIYSNNLIPGLSRLARAIKDEGASAVIQLHHGGRQAHEAKYTRAASPVYEELTGNSPRELTIEEIETIEQAFSDAAVRAAQAGFDGVEFHGANGYLIMNFLSGATNKRMDKYGGSLEKRMRFALNILNLTRKKVGPDFPIIWRSSAMEDLPGGLTFDEVKTITSMLEKNGIDAIHMASGGYGFRNVLHWIPPHSYPTGYNIHYSEEMKREKTVSIPIITVGKINDPFLAAEIVERDQADFVALARGIIADPEFPKKMAEGRPEDIRKCICCTTCLHSIFQDQAIVCSVNPLVGREGLDLEVRQAEKTKKVMVIGAGPAGMEVARVCALRGHSVDLYDKISELGGLQLQLGTKSPHKGELKYIAAYYAVQLEKLGVTIHLGVEVTPTTVDKAKPDVVVIATGAEASFPEIPGIGRDNVFTPFDVLSGKAKIGKSVVVVGGGLIGCDTADYLVAQGKQVTITTRQPEIAYNMEFISKIDLLFRCAEKNVRIETETTCKEVIDDGIIATTKGGREITIEADTVVLASGTKSVNVLETELSGKVDEVYVIGDAKEPRKIIDAIAEGYMLGRRI